MRIYFLTILLLLVSVAVFLKIGYEHTSPKGPVKKNIVCTTSMVADAVEQIVGDTCTVQLLMGPGIDPHSYKASENDLYLLENADIILFNGLHLEGKMGEIFATLASQSKALAVTDCLSREELREVGFMGVYDPHVWFDVTLWSKVVTFIAQTCSTLLPEYEKLYYSNLETYVFKLKHLDELCRQKMQAIPENKRIIVTSHDAFGYFGAAYGCEVLGLQGLSTDADISIKDITDLVEYIIAHGITVIFAETVVPSRGLEAVQQACKARGWTVTIADKLYTDALGLKNSSAGTYCGMIEHNLTVLEAALQGTVHVS